MKALKIVLLLAFVACSYSCSEDDGAIPEPNCLPTTEKYMTGKILGKQECWEDNSVYDFSSGGAGSCGQGYEDWEYQHLSMAFFIAKKDGINNEKLFTIEIPFECEDFSTKESFYNLLSVGKYEYLREIQGTGKFIITYKDASGYYSTLNTAQGKNTLEITELEKIKSPGPNSGIGQSIKFSMKINCILADYSGKHLGKMENVEVNGIYYRQTPRAETWSDYWE
ncbi:hypothetical protein [Rufibacter roseus]|uniref:Lipoprotein n=2 Tax=Rufibacter roseus TaxID=1567108 RepID=A0ABW2DN54_9BACT|nr:hypothetical protein [Rufibacter roseus]